METRHYASTCSIVRLNMEHHSWEGVLIRWERNNVLRSSPIISFAYPEMLNYAGGLPGDVHLQHRPRYCQEPGHHRLEDYDPGRFGQGINRAPTLP